MNSMTHEFMDHCFHETLPLLRSAGSLAKKTCRRKMRVKNLDTLSRGENCVTIRCREGEALGASLCHEAGSPGTMLIHHLQSIRVSILRASTHEDLHPWVGERPGLA